VESSLVDVQLGPSLSVFSTVQGHIFLSLRSLFTSLSHVSVVQGFCGRPQEDIVELGEGFLH